MHFLYKRQTRNVHVTRKKMPKQRSYERFVRKMLIKLTPEVRYKYVSNSQLLHYETYQNLLTKQIGELLYDNTC